MGWGFFCRRPGWLLGVFWSLWDWRLYSKGVPLCFLVLPELCRRQCMRSARKHPLKYSTMVRNWTPATGRTSGELSHWAIMTRVTGRTNSELSHWTIMTRATGRTDSEIHSFSHWATMARTTERTDSEIHSLFILPLSYHDPGHGEDRQWDTVILPLIYHDSGYREDRQWDTFILLLSYHARVRIIMTELSWQDTNDNTNSPEGLS